MSFTHTVPDRGGVYLILQGSVEKKMKEATTLKIISSQVKIIYSTPSTTCWIMDLSLYSYMKEIILEQWKNTS